MQTLTLLVRGMMCSRCVQSVRTALSAVRGVSGVQVSLEAGVATVWYDPRLARPGRLRGAMLDKGFDARPLC